VMLASGEHNRYKRECDKYHLVCSIVSLCQKFMPIYRHKLSLAGDRNIEKVKRFYATYSFLQKS
jgi:hypothetical protein